MAAGGTRPDPDRSREFLEQFPLDTLRMVGTLQQGENSISDLVQTSDGLIHRVVPGNYMGQNDGESSLSMNRKLNSLKLFRTGSAATWKEKPLSVLRTDA